MNPFDLAGPEFLIFYVVVFVVALVTLVAARTGLTARHTEPPRLKDPYLIAHLRGGALEPVRLAIARLVFLGEVEAGPQGRLTRTRGDDAKAPPLDAPLEEAVYDAIGAGKTGRSVATAGAVARELGALGAELEARHLVLDAAERRRLALWRGVLVALIVLVGLIKLAVALERHRSNIGFLLALAFVFPVILVLMFRGVQRTDAGHAVLAELRRLLGDARVPPPTAPEALLLAAALGAEMVGWQATVQMAFPAPVASSSSGSSCGSSSCGSSCGGGCGGGCGGCGS